LVDFSTDETILIELFHFVKCFLFTVVLEQQTKNP
jgi:hypothetical protein